MTNIYAWPPVGIVAAEWSIEQRVGRSQYLFGGGRAVSTDGPARRVATCTVSALAAGRNGAGYLEALRRLLDGGVHLVRLSSWPVIYRLDEISGAYRQTQPLDWSEGAAVLEWSEGAADLVWFTGALITAVAGTDADGWDIATVSGLPASEIVARPGEVLRVFGDGDADGVAAVVLTEARSNASGIAVLRLASAVVDGVASIGDRESAIFEVTEFSRSGRPIEGNWTYTLQFREVFASEVSEATEVNPWI